MHLFPQDWTSAHSVGKGRGAAVVWIDFLPPGQAANDGIYVSLCFGKNGTGLVAGCSISNTSKDKYKHIVTVQRPNPLIDVDGNGPGRKYNNGYINPLEVFAGNVNEELLLTHLRESIQKCKECLKGTTTSETNEMPMKNLRKSIDSKSKIKHGTKPLSVAISGDGMLKRLAAALRTKPFAILAGHSGTGKSQLVRRLAYMTCNNELLVAEGAGKAAPEAAGDRNAPAGEAGTEKGKTLWVQMPSADSGEYARLKLMLVMFQGQETIKVHFRDTKKTVAAPCWVHPSLVRELREMLGEENVVVR